MRRTILLGSFIALPLLNESFMMNPAAAEPPSSSFLDTGQEDESEVIDPVSVWPEKIVVDAQANIIMMVWFDMGEPRHTQIPSHNVISLNIVPSYEGKDAELQMGLSDGRFFLMARDRKNVNQQAQLVSAVLGKRPIMGTNKDKRIINDSVASRKSPALVLGKYDAEDALKPPAEKLVSQVKTTKSALGESLGTDFENKENKGQTSRGDVNMVVKSAMGRFRSCYQRELKKNPELSGEIVIKFGIGADGGITGAKIHKTSMGNSNVERCILKHFYSLRFLAPSGGSTVLTYPLSFSNRGAE